MCFELFNTLQLQLKQLKKIIVVVTKQIRAKYFVANTINMVTACRMNLKTKKEKVFQTVHYFKPAIKINEQN